MNPLHYPSLELCKKLTEEGFLETEMVYIADGIKDSDYFIDKTDDVERDEWFNAVCPSVMELLDCTPIDKIDIWYSYPDWRIKLKENISSDARNETLPNALAEMWLHLKQNDLLPKK